jgi:hypothetical protein
VRDSTMLAIARGVSGGGLAPTHMYAQAPGGSPNSSAGRSGAGALVIGAYSPPSWEGVQIRTIVKRQKSRTAGRQRTGRGDAAAERALF